MIIIIYFIFIECNKKPIKSGTLFERKIEFEKKKIRLQVKTFYFSQIMKS